MIGQIARENAKLYLQLLGSIIVIIIIISRSSSSNILFPDSQAWEKK